MSKIKFPIGALVRQVLPAPVVGTVREFAFDKHVSGDIDYHVQLVTTDADGKQHTSEVVFGEDELELVAAPDSPEALAVTAEVESVAAGIIAEEAELVTAANEVGIAMKIADDRAAAEAPAP